MENILINKKCFITGVTGAVGFELARLFAKNKCKLFITGRNHSKLIKRYKKLKLEFPKEKIFFKQCDLIFSNEVDKLCKLVLKKLKNVDILVNCAGIFSIENLNQVKSKKFDEIFAVNVKAPVIITKNFVESMRLNRWGRIINIGSSSSYEGFEKTALYCASKHALLGFSRSIYKEYKKYGIRSLIFSPGSIKSKMGKKIKNQSYRTFLNAKDVAQVILSNIQSDAQLVIPETIIKRIISL
jgi:3-oxoacyl-[acyl-carrier protein] reductase